MIGPSEVSLAPAGASINGSYLQVLILILTQSVDGPDGNGMKPLTATARPLLLCQGLVSVRDL